MVVMALQPQAWSQLPWRWTGLRWPLQTWRLVRRGVCSQTVPRVSGEAGSVRWHGERLQGTK
jgi:hypothetical protein